MKVEPSRDFNTLKRCALKRYFILHSSPIHYITLFVKNQAILY